MTHYLVLGNFYRLRSGNEVKDFYIKNNKLLKGVNLTEEEIKYINLNFKK